MGCEVGIRPVSSKESIKTAYLHLTTIGKHRNLMVRVKQGGDSLAHIMTCSHDSHHVLENVAGGALG